MYNLILNRNILFFVVVPNQSAKIENKGKIRRDIEPSHTHTESERSLLPTAQQQYGQLGLGVLPFFCFFLKILGLNFCKEMERN